MTTEHADVLDEVLADYFEPPAGREVPEQPAGPEPAPEPEQPLSNALMRVAYIEALLSRLQWVKVDSEQARLHLSDLMNHVERALDIGVQRAPRSAPAEPAAAPSQPEPTPEVTPAQAAAILGKAGGEKGGAARAASMTGPERSDASKKAASARWSEQRKVPAQWEQMLRYEQLAYLIVSAGGKATNAELVRFWRRMSNEPESVASGRVSTTLSNYKGKFTLTDGYWTVVPGWFEPPAKLADLRAPVAASAGAPPVADGAQCRNSPTGAHHWLVESGTGANASGKCKFCPATRNDFLNVSLTNSLGNIYADRRKEPAK